MNTTYQRKTSLLLKHIRGNMTFHQVNFDQDFPRDDLYLSVRKTNIWIHFPEQKWQAHYSDVILGAMASQITCVSIVYSTVCSGSDQKDHQSSATLAFVRGIHRWPVISPHKGPVKRKMFSFQDIIMIVEIKLSPAADRLVVDSAHQKSTYAKP